MKNYRISFIAAALACIFSGCGDSKPAPENVSSVPIEHTPAATEEKQQVQDKNGIVNLKEGGNSFEALIPDGWKTLSSAVGDLNKDGVKDLAFVIQNTDPRNLEWQEDLGADTVDLNPRILAIYFGSNSGKYEKQVQANNFILLRDSPTMDEPFAGMQITEKGILQIDFNLWYSAGSWTTSNHSYKFRFKNNQFELIGYDLSETNRGSGETTDHSVNFLSRKMMIAKGSIEEEKPQSVEWREFRLNSLKTIETLKKPFEWEFEGIYL